MKKIYFIFLAGIAAFAAASCAKDVPPAEPMAPTQVQQKLSDVAVATLQEVDPDLWKDWGLSGIQLYEDFITLGKNTPADTYDISEIAFKETTEVNGNVTTITRILQLSLLKGDITESDGKFVYTESGKPLSFTLTSGGKTYKIQLESTGENGDGIIFSEHIYSDLSEGGKTEIERSGMVVPQKAAIHITENGKLFMDVVLSPVVEDKNANGKLDEEDIISGSAYIQIPDYAITLRNLIASKDNITASVDLYHGNKSIVSINAEVELDLFVEPVKAPSASVSLLPDDISGTISLLGGQALIKADIDLGDIRGISMAYSSKADADEVAAVFSKNAKADLYFDNNPTVQASLCFLTQQNAESWLIVPGIHFYDGSADMTYIEFGTSFMTNTEVSTPTMGAVASFLTKIQTYFGEYLSKKGPEVK